MKNLKSNIKTLLLLNFLCLNFMVNAQNAHSDSSVFSMRSLVADLETEALVIHVADTQNSAEEFADSTIDLEKGLEVDAHIGENYKKYLTTKNNEQNKKSYRYTSSFASGLTIQLEALLNEELGQPNQVGEEEKEWNNLDGKKISGLEISLKTGRCNIRYSGENPNVIQRITTLTQKICKLTYRGNCD